MDNNLVKVKRNPSQTRLTREERLKNVKNVYKVRDPQILKDKSIRLLDDVFTTGATLNECAKVLKKAGARRVEGITLARGE